MEIFGRAPAIAGGNAATGSSRYSFKSSSDIGTDAQKYENVLLSGIMSPRKRSANWRTLSLERSNWAGMSWTDTILYVKQVRNRGVARAYAIGHVRMSLAPRLQRADPLNKTLQT